MTPHLNRRLFYILVLIVFCYGFLELASFSALILIDPDFSPARLNDDRARIASAPSAHSAGFGSIEEKCYTEVLHPYLGFVRTPEGAPAPASCEVDSRVSEYGFPDLDSVPKARDPRKTIVAFFGGSFAQGASLVAESVLKQELGALACFAGTEIEVMTLAMGGYKEPQQLLTFAYFLSLGAHFDVVITLDGFNEVALPLVENGSKEVAPFFPRSWFGRVGKFEGFLLAALAERDELERRRRFWAGVFAGPLRYSFTANAFWFAYDRVLARQVADLQGSLLQAQPGATPNYTITGPREKTAQSAGSYARLADIWKSSSLQMARLAAANSMLYAHFLQPNQYVAASKPLHPRELKGSFRLDHPYRPGVVAGYPLLIQAGQELVQARVNFFDLTMLFATNLNPLYVDDCCHLNKRGYTLVAKEIARRIGDVCTVVSSQ